MAGPGEAGDCAPELRSQFFRQFVELFCPADAYDCGPAKAGDNEIGNAAVMPAAEHDKAPRNGYRQRDADRFLRYGPFMIPLRYFRDIRHTVLSPAARG